MYFDYWHIRRYLSLAGMDPEEALPFGEPPLVLGSVVSMPEPVWKAAVATVLAHGTEDVFQHWKWQNPLPTTSAAKLLDTFQAVVADVKATGAVSQPADLAPEDHIDADTALAALSTVRDILALAVERDAAVETWAE